MDGLFNRYSVMDLDMEKEIVTGLLFSDEYTKQLVPVFNKYLFQVSYIRLLSGWCIEYYNTYKKAPAENIIHIVKGYMEQGKVNEDDVELIHKFLQTVKPYDNKNIDFYVDRAEKYLRKRRLEQLRDDLSSLCLVNDVDKAENAVATFKRIARPKTIGIDIFRDEIIAIMDNDLDKLFRMRGALGDLIGDFCRQDFVAVAAPMKRGKTYWLQEIAIEAMQRELNIVFYSFEMSEKKMLRRIYQQILGETKNEYIAEINYPYFDHDGRIKFRKSNKKGLSTEMIERRRKRLVKYMHNKFLLCTYPTGSINVDDVRNHLDTLLHFNNFVPDVIVIDYADIMAPERFSSRDERHKLNDTWKALRGLAQERNCLVVTATQTNRSTFNKDIEESDIAEDIRKLAHATTVIALNQDKEDKKNNIMRVKVLVSRDDVFHVDDEVIVLECREVGRCYVDSRWSKDVKIDHKE